jgi:hypothetical protein
MRNEHYQDNFSHNTGDVASHNRVSFKTDLAAASGTAITIAVIFVIFLITVTITYLAIVHMSLLDIVIKTLFIGGFILLLFKGINHAIREVAKTRAMLIHYNAQPLRDNLIEVKQGIAVLYDPHERYRVENASTVSETYHINEKQQPAIAETPESKRPARLSRLLQESERDYAANS